MKPLPVEGCVPRELLLPLAGKRVLFTGYNGFIGRWMKETLEHANVGAGIGLVGRGDSWCFAEGFDYVVHCTEDGIGHHEAARLAAMSGGRMLHLSSGAVYGNRLVAPATEPMFGHPDTGYARLKVMQELDLPHAIICRLFSFVGPGLRRHVGKKFLEVNPIVVSDDGAVRSFLYAGELARWLWTCLLHGTPGRVYNVGGSSPTTVVNLAKVCGDIREVDVVVNPASSGGTYYVPDVTRVEAELGLRQEIGPIGAIRRTLEWQRGEVCSSSDSQSA